MRQSLVRPCVPGVEDSRRPLLLNMSFKRTCMFYNTTPKVVTSVDLQYEEGPESNPHKLHSFVSSAVKAHCQECPSRGGHRPFKATCIGPVKPWLKSLKLSLLITRSRSDGEPCSLAFARVISRVFPFDSCWQQFTALSTGKSYKKTGTQNPCPRTSVAAQFCILISSGSIQDQGPAYAWLLRLCLNDGSQIRSTNENLQT